MRTLVDCLSSPTEGEPAGGNRRTGQSKESTSPRLVLQQDHQHVGPPESPAAVLPQPGEKPGIDQEIPPGEVLVFRRHEEPTEEEEQRGEPEPVSYCIADSVTALEISLGSVETQPTL